MTVTTKDFLLPGLPKAAARPILAIEPALEATAATRWLGAVSFRLGKGLKSRPGLTER